MKSDNIRLLLVEPDAEREARLREVLARTHHGNFVIERVLAHEDAARSLAHGEYDVVLLDIGARSEGVGELVRSAIARAPGLNVVVLADELTRESADLVIRSGAQDCLARDEAEEPSLALALRRAAAHRRRSGAGADLLLDEATGLYTLNGFLIVTDPLARLAARIGHPLALLVFHYDRLFEIREKFGEAAEREALIEASVLLQDLARESDVLARLGPDQFGLLLNDAEKRAAETVLMRVIEAVEAHNVRQIHPWRLSFGIAFAQFDPKSPSPIEALLSDARSALADRKLRSFRLG